MDNPSVTILSPCYNVGRFLPKYFETVLGQTYSNLQVVLIDDGSKDDTWTVMQEYAARDSRVEIYHQENQGVAATRNNLLDKVKGDYVLFVDSDDWIELDMVEYLVSLIIKNDADVAMCDNVINDASAETEKSIKIYDKDTTIKEFLFHKELRGSLWNKLVKTSLLHNVKFHCGISYGEDALFCWHYFQNINKIVISDRRLYHYRMVETSLCHSSFGPKKLSAHYAWAQICDETARWWPQFLTIAQARHCIEDILLLRDATHCGYKQMSDIDMLQNTVKMFWNTLNKVDITTLKMKIYAFLACRNYWFASKI